MKSIIIGIAGGTGSGKTTLARILLGFERADAGQVIIDGIVRLAPDVPVKVIQ